VWEREVSLSSHGYQAAALLLDVQPAGGHACILTPLVDARRQAAATGEPIENNISPAVQIGVPLLGAAIDFPFNLTLLLYPL
jgi:hypothetical protein